MSSQYEYFRHKMTMESPASSLFLITPNDGSDLRDVTRSIYVGGAGDLRVETIDGDDVVIPDLPAGIIFPVFATKVFSTNTTATGLVGLCGPDS